MTRRLKVAEGTQVSIDGKVYAAVRCSTSSPPESRLAGWGTVVVDEPAPAKRKASRAK